MSWINEELIEYTLVYDRDIKGVDRFEQFGENLFKMFQVDLAQQIKYQFYYLKQAGLQPSEILPMAYWEWDLMVDELKDFLEKEQNQREREEKEQQAQYGDTKDMMGSSMKNFSNYSMPKF